MLSRCLKEKLGVAWIDNLFSASMDHSPSEQLDKSCWYTSVLVIAQAGEDFSLAKKIADKTKSQAGGLRKWAGARAEYKKRFREGLLSGLLSDDVYIFAFSRTRDWIIENSSYSIEQLQAKHAYARFEKNEKFWSRIGPFKEAGGEERFIEMSENRALMVFDLAHYVSRIYQAMWRARPDNIGNYLRWSLYSDKFPGGQAMGELFSALLSINNSMYGGIKCLEYVESDSALTDLLADNLAGFLNESISGGVDLLDMSEGKGLLFWEILGSK